MNRNHGDVIVEKSKLGNLTKIGQGGQASVYLAPDFTLPGSVGPLVLKQYRKKLLDKHGNALRNGMPELILFPDRLSIIDQQYLAMRAVWPKALVVENNKALGILMKIIPDTFFFDMAMTTGTKRLLLELQHFYRTDAQKYEFAIPIVSDKDKFLLIIKMIQAVDFFHNNGLVLGDFSPRNVVVSHPQKLDGKNRGKLYPKFLDIDSFRFAGGQPPIEQMNTPGWYPPEIRAAQDHFKMLSSRGAGPSEIATAEAHMRNLNKRTDVFKFGLFVLRLFHPHEDAIAIYISKESEDNIRKLIGTKRSKVVLAALEENPNNRPDMSEIFRQFKP